MSDKPLCIDLFCGLGGWSEAFLAEGYRCVGYDIEAHDYGSGGYPGELVIRDVRSIHGSEFKDAAIIVASPPCQEYSYMAMPWSRAKAKAAAIAADTSGAMRMHLTELFNQCFRIQREASEAAGHHIPLIVENVRGAQKWVGQAKANYGSFFLWGDVGMVGNRVVCVVNGKLLGGRGVFAMKAAKVPGFRFDGSGKSFQTASVEATAAVKDLTGRKTPEGNGSQSLWKDRAVPRYAHPTAEEMERNGLKVSNVVAARRYREGVKHDGSGWRENGTLRSSNRMVADKWFQDGAARHGSRSNSRKAASAMIAKIPFPLAQHIARSLFPR